MRFLVIRNPNAGQHRQGAFSAYLEALGRRGAEIDQRHTAGPGDAIRFAATAGQDVDMVIAAGGDGTINEVVNGLVEHPSPPLFGVFPLGTANVYAAEIGLPFKAEPLADCLMAARSRKLHLGRVDSLGEPAPRSRHFVLMAGAGFDAQVVAKVDPAVKKRLGKGAYAIETLSTFLKADAAGPILRVDGEAFATSSAIAVNARYYAGRFVLSKRASPFSPELDLCLFHKTGRLATIGYLCRVAMGLIETSSTYTIKQVTGFEITGPPGAAIQADGDIIAHAPCRISLAESTIQAVVPDG